MALGTMPESITVKGLDSKSSEYYSDKMRQYDALYEGGDKFNSMKEDFLPKRPIEKAGDSVGGNAHYELRKKNAYYTNYAGGIIDWFSAKIVENQPRIVVGDGVKNDASREYWESLNTNADGRGNPLVTVCRWAAREVIVNLRSYFDLNMPEESSEDGRICLFDASTVDDWDADPDGNLLWIRRHTMEVVRDEAQPWMQPELEAHYWTFYDEDKIVVYRAEKKISARQWDQNAVANKIKEVTHEFGMPVFDIRSDKSLWIMDRIKEPVIKLFQREASLNFYLDSLCYQMPVLNLVDTNKFKALPVTPMGALVLELEEKAGFFSPDPSGFEPNFKAVEQCKQSFYESLQVLAKEAAALPQAGRLSGEAITTMQKPMEVLIGSFAWPIEDALNRLIEKLKIYRGEPNADIKLEGFGRVSVDESEVKQLITGEDEDGSGEEEAGEAESNSDGPGTVEED